MEINLVKMEAVQQKAVLFQCSELCCESDDSDIEFVRYIFVSSDDSEEENVISVIQLHLNKRRDKVEIRPRVKNYIERIVPNYTAEEFKTHFRLLPATFEFLLGLIGPALSTTKLSGGRKPISAQKQRYSTSSFPRL
ncbi:uncharacterized protein LOC105281106 isoform X3 [Ooceraea biroi]|uniref:uncharacterized protein LOC105281106 isoform X3 n=1 Tax=Ooceraea biroi TaxID=2015173 RepID=UPI000F07E1E5|nr:uncharacterized protein LOC105281106 isoform X3 [Ooceraea biroi]